MITPLPENPTILPSSASSIKQLTVTLSLICAALAIYLTVSENSLQSVICKIQNIPLDMSEIIIARWTDQEKRAWISREEGVARRFNSIQEVKNHTKRFNFANSYSGAKISQKSKGMLQTKAILTDDPDSYLMTPNNQDPKYFVISLSEDIQIETLMLTNQERYSSRVRHFSLYGSIQDPSETWIPLGNYLADDSNQWQAFAVPKKQWVRHLKLVIESVHNPHEYYCILTQIKVFGASLMQGIKEDLKIISKQPEETTNLTSNVVRTKDAPERETQDSEDVLVMKQQGIPFEAICPNPVNLSSLLGMSTESPQLGLSENKVKYLKKFQELKLQMAEKRNQLKYLAASEEELEEQASVFKQLAQSLDDMKIYHYLLEQYLLVDFAEAMESKLKKVQLVQDQILRAVKESNEDQVNLVKHSVQRQAEKVQLELVNENKALQQQIFVFEVIVILLLVLVLVVSLQRIDRKCV